MEASSFLLPWACFWCRVANVNLSSPCGRRHEIVELLLSVVFMYVYHLTIAPENECIIYLETRTKVLQLLIGKKNGGFSSLKWVGIRILRFYLFRTWISEILVGCGFHFVAGVHLLYGAVLTEVL